LAIRFLLAKAKSDESGNQDGSNRGKKKNNQKITPAGSGGASLLEKWERI